MNGSVRASLTTSPLTMSPSAVRVRLTKLPRPSAHWQADEVPTTGRQELIGRALESRLGDAEVGLHAAFHFRR